MDSRSGSIWLSTGRWASQCQGSSTGGTVTPRTTWVPPRDKISSTAHATAATRTLRSRQYQTAATISTMSSG